MSRLYTADDEARYVTEDGPSTPARDQYRRDFARVIHSPSFRRLQGKTQLFPGYESDFFRNRLTHSLEVGQIAESIAHCINFKHRYFRENNINPRICFTAALLHDIGHPPFGHNGEEALDERMRSSGGFEGNAQTLRIVTQIEKKRHKPGVESLLLRRAGLNLTYRTLAAVLKYDSVIAEDRSSETKVAKGYYIEDQPIVVDIKKQVAPAWTVNDGPFKTIECSIMDLSDDIAYSTYDLEDSFKAGFLTPAKMLASDSALLDRVAERVGKRIGEPAFAATDVLGIFSDMFHDQVTTETYDRIGTTGATDAEKIVASMILLEQLDNAASESEVRTAFTSNLVGNLVENVEVNFNSQFPQLSSVCLPIHLQRQVETLKIYTYEAVIASNRVKLAEFRGKEVVGGIFDALSGEKGSLLLPHDIARLFHAAEGDERKERRVIADFIAGMTDRYALEFFGRLHSDSPQTIFKDA